MNEIQKLLKDTEKDFLNDSYHGTSEALRQYTIRQIEKQIEHLEKRKERLEAGFDDYMIY